MKKILYIITQSEFGGAQRYIFDLATHLAGKFNIIVAAGECPDGELFTKLNIWKSDFHGKADFPKIETVHLKHLKRAISPWHDLFAFFEIYRLIKQEKPDIIHLNSSKASILGSLAAKFAYSHHSHKNPHHSHKNPHYSHYIIYTAHGWVFNEPLSWLRQKLYFYTEKWTAKLKDKIICVSEYDRQTAIAQGFSANKLITIHNGINIHQLKFLKKEDAQNELMKRINQSFKLQASSFKIAGAIANLYPTKGIEHLIEAARIVLDDIRKDVKEDTLSRVVQFVVIGEGKERPKLEKLIKKYSLEDNFLLIGHISDAYKYLRVFDIFVLPSIKEGMPYTILEAMAAGLPIIAAKIGGLPEMIENEKSGYLVEPANAALLAEKIAYLLKNPEIAQNLGKQAQKIVNEKFGLQKMIRETAKIYYQQNL